MAPFTTDATLDTTGHHVANVDGAFGYDASGIAFNGFYAIMTNVGEITVARGSDGATQKVSSGDNPRFCEPVYVDANEVWSLICEQGIPSAVAFRRYALAAWP